ncbi:MAG: hypothetical protein ACRETL_06415, partial [Gammaproteobacteria bacterium]
TEPYNLIYAFAWLGPSQCHLFQFFCGTALDRLVSTCLRNAFQHRVTTVEQCLTLRFGHEKSASFGTKWARGFCDFKAGHIAAVA